MKRLLWVFSLLAFLLVFTGRDNAQNVFIPQSMSPIACVDTSGSPTAQNCNTVPPFTVTAPASIFYKTSTTNSGDLTINVNGLGAVHVRKQQGTATLAMGDMQVGIYTLLTYDGTYWEAYTTTESGGGIGGSGTTGYLPEFATSGTLQDSPCDDAITNSPAMTCLDAGGFYFTDPNAGTGDGSTFQVTVDSGRTRFKSYGGDFIFEDAEAENPDGSYFTSETGSGGFALYSNGGNFNLSDFDASSSLSSISTVVGAGGVIYNTYSGSFVVSDEEAGSGTDGSYFSVLVDGPFEFISGDAAGDAGASEFLFLGGPIDLPTTVFANLGVLIGVQAGSEIYCTDCKGPQDIGTTWGSIAAGSGTGSSIVYDGSNWLAR